MVDAIEVLIAESCIEAAILQLRSGCEAVISMMYLLADPAKYEQRARAWWYCNQLELIETLKNVGSKQPDVSATNPMVWFVVTPKVPRTAEEIAENQVQIDQATLFLAGTQFARFPDAYKKAQKNTQYPSWFSLFGGPKSLRQLANKVGAASLYEFAYNDWSKTTHAVGMTRHLRKSSPTQLDIHAIRAPERIDLIVTAAISFLLTATHYMLRKFNSSHEQEFKQWIATNVGPPLNAVQGRASQNTP